MFKNYFKTAWRSLWKNKFYTLINISGLGVGLATGIMLLLWVQNELSYDKFHPDYKNIYQLSSHLPSNGSTVTWEWVPGPLAVYAKSIPQVQSIVRTGAQGDQVISTKDKSKMLDGNIAAYVDSGFFSMFNFKLLQGDKARLFPNNNSVVLTQALAQKLFNNENPVGKIINYSGSSFTITGVLQNFPVNSSIKYDAIFPMGFYAQQFTANGGNGDWKTIDEDLGDYAFITYVKLQPNTDFKKTADAFSAAYKKARNGDSNTSFQLENIGDVHLISADGNDSALKMVRIFMLVVILLLAIASINYVNLSTARSLIRAKEVSIRKIIGAKKQQLFIQFIVETFIVFCFAIAAAGVLIYLLMPLYNDISGKELSFSLTDVAVRKAAGLAIAGTVIASGIYPALLLSSFNPIQSLKGKITSGIGVNTMRKALVVFQFAISVVLLVCTIIMSSQMQFIKNTDVGYDKSYVFAVPLTQEVTDHTDAVKTELRKQPGILNVATSDAYDIADISSSTGDLDWPGKPENTTLYITGVDADKDFIPTLKIKFLEGDNFSGTPSDSAHFILNETAVKQMGLKAPYVGQQISLHDWKGTILGVVKDFNFKSLKEKVSPLIFFSRWKPNILYVRTTAAGAQQAIAATQQLYKKYSGNIPFSYNFLDKSFEAHYKSEQHAGLLFNVFAGIAIFISCLGLFGLATYTAQAKIKEIGIRKVLGASVAGIITLISKDFLKLVIISIVIAIPVAWWAMNKWLQEFAYRINISWWVFLIAAVIALLIAVLTVSFQAIKAAVANPVKSLRTE
ncbi:MAG TPA: ABC transporter permease [Parafilimonas sp.]|nr:ABC transporter permease [Parafilimonas sp.]